MPRVVVDVMLKPEILDPQGQAVAGALPGLGLTGVRSVRQGKRFEIELDVDAARSGGRSALRERVEHIAATLLANPVIEDYAVRFEDDSQHRPDGPTDV